MIYSRDNSNIIILVITIRYQYIIVLFVMIIFYTAYKEQIEGVNAYLKNFQAKFC